ncbi:MULTISPECIES: PepSY domain-containing protein [unclassified Arcicella]|uniref:PepSY domain-containing protein n=1 Tax=unclassified Arcicella TaxID=2644986 RepID=UPI0028614075|nr:MULTISPECIES: PepSY domain-containing protein [unclassified Arcicella]MDR6562093.1 putative iron-regulated membrane protein [Arcicella sp. BE51]MDR6811965.1 putative iron-regulated membrane protein [Arcicella sp. BE140]MDR6822995.1 putative iron-regulated membrane protein [Arcicella sp. BE139]
MKKSFHFRIRKIHRYLGLALGIQFLFWTIGGLYFSWSDMDEIHGDHQKAHIHPLSANIQLANPQIVIQQIKQTDAVNYIFDIKLVQILGKPTYQIVYSQQHDRGKKIKLADAETGKIRGVLTKSEAIEVAKRSFIEDAKVSNIEYLTTTNGHHEYREQPLPAYAITFEHPSKTTVYVATELGTVQKFRNQRWRIFDFLWMLHTMDFQGRDNISNYLLRAFSIFGLLTILSGFILFWVSAKAVNERKKRKV